MLAALLASPSKADETAAAAKREETALSAVCDELLSLAKLCEEASAPDEARRALELGLTLLPSSKALRSELAKLSGKDGKTPEASAARIEAARKASHEKCGELLAALAQADEKAGSGERFERHAMLVLEHFPRDELMERLGVVWFEPYAKLVRASDAKLLEAGGELVDGKWLERAAVSALDEQHAKWASPWVVSDGAHEVRTTLPLRTARRLLAHVSAFRAFLLSQLQGSWALEPPHSKLRVVATGTQADFTARVQAERERLGSKDASAPTGTAIYLHSQGAPGPCLVTLEPRFQDGSTVKVSEDGALPSLRHELTHQIVFEYSKHAADRTRNVRFQAWCVEGLARFMGTWELERGKWRLPRRRTIDLGGARVAGPFAWCKAHKGALRPLEKLFALTREELAKGDDYDQAATVSYFLLEGEGRRYRSAFLRLLETVHEVRDDEKTLDACFPGIDRKALEDEWLRFLDGIELEE